MADESNNTLSLKYSHSDLSDPSQKERKKLGSSS